MGSRLKQRGSKKHLIGVFSAVFAVAGLVYFLASGLEKTGTQIPSPLIGKKAPPIKVEWLQGKDLVESASEKFLTLEDLKGRPIVLNFWASWCVSCRTEAYDFEKYWRAFKSQDVVVLGVAIQTETADAVAFANQFGKTYLLARDVDGKVSIDYGITGVPETFFINRKGYVIHKEARPISYKLLMNLSQKIL